MTEDHPQIPNTPGIRWRTAKYGWLVTWRARTDLIKRGYLPKNVTLWISSKEWPTIGEVEGKWISDRCVALQDEMILWARGGVPVIKSFAGDLKSLIGAYQHDTDSPYQKLRYSSRKNYQTTCGRIEGDVWVDEEGIERCIGDTLISEISARKVLRWHRMWTKGGEQLPIGHALIGMLRTLLTFGATILDDPHCRSAKVMLHDMRFPMAQPRKERLTADQASALRDMARAQGLPAIALAQAFQFECTLRQKDVIGEYVPLSELGVSVVLDGNAKWLSGIQWHEIDQSMRLIHTTSKRQKEIIVDLKLAPMVLEELAKQYPAAVRMDGGLDRSVMPASGPIIVCEATSRPYWDHEFRRQWRALARRCGIPDTVYNMDTRAGAISEATDAGAPLEDVRHAATHSNTNMTARYSRGAEGKVAGVMQTRVAHRNKPRTDG